MNDLRVVVTHTCTGFMAEGYEPTGYVMAWGYGDCIDDALVDMYLGAGVSFPIALDMATACTYTLKETTK